MDTSLYPPSYQQKLLTLLSEEWDLDANTDGVLIHSDNFQALNLLQARYREQVKCIYIDPPYNTGNDGFIYKDNYQHSSWLTTMENRLQAAYPLLRQDGVNFISIDDNEQARAKEVSDFIFGEKNFIANVIWQKKYSPSNDAKWLSDNHDFIVTYAKNKEIWRPDLLPRSEEATARYKNPDNDPRGVWKSGDMSVKTYSVSTDYPITVPSGRVVNPPAGRCWRVSKDRFDELVADNRIWFGEDGNNVPSVKRFLSEVKDGITPLTVWTYQEAGHNQEAKKETVACFNVGQEISTEAMSKITPKPIRLLNRIFTIGAKDQSALILDYFAGSGTTAHAVINLNREDGGNRKYILVEQGEYFDTVLKPRVQKVIYSENWKNGKPMPSEKQSNGFNGVSQIVKVLKLESYEDTLNNLELKGQADFIGGLPDSVQEDYLLRYLLDVESKGSLLNSDDFTHPFDYCLNIATDSAGAYTKTNIDLVETFNYLLGLRVQHITDEREKRGYVMVEGALPNGDRCLIVWRDVEKMGYAEVAQFFNAQNINPNSDQYDVVYLNGDHDMASLWQNEDGTESRLSLRAIEPEFLRLMFAQKGE
ncbi:site-specific DNA-methyltransferase [Avibacterium paragallinarum]|uniref:site-specific DNA-methyltransferase n=1 Tax=Avibacterium paragallinarum TaxID=728 RepID=UPI0021F6FDB0|nr:site-specific DNA-methyltransferase [Avibacterium paragallinarum]UXN33967.1 site-specific DNA-methyltransferase [Avibacterium paragallinarum]